MIFKTQLHHMIYVSEIISNNIMQKKVNQKLSIKKIIILTVNYIGYFWTKGEWNCNMWCHLNQTNVATWKQINKHVCLHFFKIK